jgi:hypothetical protein
VWLQKRRKHSPVIAVEVAHVVSHTQAAGVTNKVAVVVPVVVVRPKVAVSPAAEKVVGKADSLSHHRP